MTYLLDITGDELKKVIMGRYYSFRQDIHDSQHTSGSPQAISAGTPVRFTNDTLTRNDVVSPYYITSRWNTTDNKVAFPEEIDSPTYVAEIGFVFDPSVAAAGDITLTVWIDDDTPKDIKVYTAKYKAVAEKQSIIATWYLGDDAGFDAKNDGVYFELEFEGAGDLYNKTLVIYRT